MCHISHVRCQVSVVRRQVSPKQNIDIEINFKKNKFKKIENVVQLVCGGSVISRATPSNFPLK